MSFIEKEYQSKIELQSVDERAINEIAAKVGEEAAKRVKQTIDGNNPFIDTIEYASGGSMQLVISGCPTILGSDYSFKSAPLPENGAWLASRIVTNISGEKFGAHLYSSNFRTGNDSFAVTRPNGINENYHLDSERFHHKDLPDVPRDTILVEIIGKLAEENTREFLIWNISK